MSGLVGPNGKLIGTESVERAAMLQEIQRLSMENRYGRMALRALAVFLLETKHRRRIIPKAELDDIEERQWNLVMREMDHGERAGEIFVAIISKEEAAARQAAAATIDPADVAEVEEVGDASEG